MPELAQVLDNIVPISDFSRGKAGRAFDKVASGGTVVVMRNCTPAAVIVPPDEYKELCAAREDLILMSFAEERLSANEGIPAISEKEAMAALGISDDDVDSAGDQAID